MVQQLLDEITEKLNILENLPSQTYSNLSTLDKEQSDVLHMIEFGNFNACEGYKLAKRLQEIRWARRNAKDTIEKIKKSQSTIDKYKSLKQSLQKSSMAVCEVSESHENRKYKTRVIDSKDDIANLRSVNKTDIKFRVNKQVDRMTELFGQIESGK